MSKIIGQKIVIWTCGRCVQTVRHEYEQRQKRNGQILSWRYLANGSHVTEQSDSRCSVCETHNEISYRKGAEVKGVLNADIPCSGACTHAKGTSCECSCAGKNHGIIYSV